MAVPQPNILITYPHNLGDAGIRSAIERVATAMGTKYGIAWVWKGSTVVFEANSGLSRGVKGTIDTLPNQIRIAVFLPLMLRSFQRSITEGIDEVLREQVR